MVEAHRRCGMMVVVKLFVAFLLALPLLAVFPFHSSNKNDTFVLKDVRLIDGTDGPPFEHASILISKGKIAQIVANNKAARWPANTRVIELAGRTVIPGLINAHGHVGVVEGAKGADSSHYTEENVERQLTQYERYGVTSEMALGMNKDLVYKIRSEQQSGKIGGATLLTAGRGIGVPDGVPGVAVGEDQVYRPKTSDEARSVVDEMAKHHPTLIKFWVDDDMGKRPKPDPAVYGAAIDEAHSKHLRVAAHVYALADAKRLLADHIDVLAHSIRDQVIDDDTAQQIVKQHVYYIPTLQLEDAFFIYAEHPRWMNTLFFKDALSPDVAAMLNSDTYRQKTEKDPSTKVHQQALEMAMKNIRVLSDAGANIGFGTDSGAMPTRIQGFAEHRELELMVQAGMTPLEAIHSATGVNASLLGIQHERGTIEIMKAADLLVLEADPTNDILNTRKIAMIFHNGEQTIPPFATDTKTK